MNIGVYILFLLASIGAINGLIAGIILLCKKNSPPNIYYLGGLLIALSIRIGKSVLHHFIEDLDKLILQIGLSACLFIGPFFYLFIKSTLSGKSVFERRDLIGLGVLLISILILGIIFPYRTDPEIWNQIIAIGIYAVWACFVILGLFIYRKQIVEQIRPANIKDILNEQVFIISIAVTFITLTYQFAMYISGFTYIWGSIIFSFFFYYMMITIILKNLNISAKQSTSKPLSNGAELKTKIDDVMLSEQLYMNPKLKLDDLSKAVNLNRNILSKVLNETYSSGFSRYVNEFRVEAAKKMIEVRDDLSLEGIGYEAGFNSKSSFFAAFKKITASTPAEFKKSLSK